MKKILIIILSLFSLGLFFGIDNLTFAKAPLINCEGLPGCDASGLSSPTVGKNSQAVAIIAKIISEMIKYTSVIAVIALMIAGIMYLISGGEEEKIKKAKRWIIWALIGVLVSVSAWFIVNLINNLYFF